MLKRAFDFSLAIVGLFLSILLWVAIILAIRLRTRGPVFYLQERVGKGGKTFVLYKFRTMYMGAEDETGPIWAVENDSRVTNFGQLLRNSGLDELPQLVNIVKGEMSFVGPRPERPELMEELLHEVPEFGFRTSVRPGLTGIAQIYGQFDTKPHQKLRFDMLYIRRRSLWLDLKLILLSFWITFRRRWGVRVRKF